MRQAGDVDISVMYRGQSSPYLVLTIFTITHHLEPLTCPGDVAPPAAGVSTEHIQEQVTAGQTKKITDVAIRTWRYIISKKTKYDTRTKHI